MRTASCRWETNNFSDRYIYVQIDQGWVPFSGSVNNTRKYSIELVQTMTGQRRTKMPCNAEDPNGNLFFWRRRWKGRSGNLSRKSEKPTQTRGASCGPKHIQFWSAWRTSGSPEFAKSIDSWKCVFFIKNSSVEHTDGRAVQISWRSEKIGYQLSFLRPIMDDHFLLLEGCSSFEYSALNTGNLQIRTRSIPSERDLQKWR